jgi:hypothetical protein
LVKILAILQVLFFIQSLVCCAKLYRAQQQVASCALLKIAIGRALRRVRKILCQVRDISLETLKRLFAKFNRKGVMNHALTSGMSLF